MGLPQWTDGLVTVGFSVGALAPLVPYEEIERQVANEDSRGRLQVYDVSEPISVRVRTYRGVSYAETAAFLDFRRRPTVKYRGNPVSYTEEDGSSYQVRLMAVSHERLENGDYQVTVTMREEPA